MPCSEGSLIYFAVLQSEMNARPLLRSIVYRSIVRYDLHDVVLGERSSNHFKSRDHFKRVFGKSFHVRGPAHIVIKLYS